MAPWNAETLIDRGPDFVRNFIDQPHAASEFAPEFSWLLLAEFVDLEVNEARSSNPAAAARWAEIGAVLYDRLARSCRPQDDLARDIWTRAAARYRAQASGSPPPTGVSPEAREPRPI